MVSQRLRLVEVLALRGSSEFVRGRAAPARSWSAVPGWSCSRGSGLLGTSNGDAGGGRKRIGPGAFGWWV